VLISLVHISQSLQITESPEHIEHNQFIDSKKYIIYRDFAYIIETKSDVDHIFLCSNLILMKILIYVTNYLYFVDFWQVDAPNKFTWMHLHQTWLDGSEGKDDAPWFI
jgi:hypothetical protein